MARGVAVRKVPRGKSVPFAAGAGRRVSSVPDSSSWKCLAQPVRRNPLGRRIGRVRSLMEGK